MPDESLEYTAVKLWVLAYQTYGCLLEEELLSPYDIPVISHNPSYKDVKRGL